MFWYLIGFKIWLKKRKIAVKVKKTNKETSSEFQKTTTTTKKKVRTRTLLFPPTPPFINSNLLLSFPFYFPSPPLTENKPWQNDPSNNPIQSNQGNQPTNQWRDAEGRKNDGSGDDGRWYRSQYWCRNQRVDPGYSIQRCKKTAVGEICGGNQRPD